MEILIYIVVFSAVIGVLLGWFSKCGLFMLATRCALASVLLGIVAACYMDDAPEFISWGHLATAVVYCIYPFVVFLFLPSLSPAIIAYYTKLYFHKK